MAYQKLQAGQAIAVVPSDTISIPAAGGVQQSGSATATTATKLVNSAGAFTNGCVLYVGVAGDVKVKTAAGNDVVFTGVPAGSFMPVQVTQVFATGTTATNIVALW